jgi:hypothetical protein
MNMRWFAVSMVVVAAFAGYACSGDDDAATGATGDTGTASGGNSAGGAGGGTVTCFDGLESIAISPDNGTVTLDGVNAAPIQFTATGSFSDGRSEEIPGNQLRWAVSRDDDTPPGIIANGLLNPYPNAGGVVTVTATDTCIEGTTTAVFFLDATIGMPSDPTAWGGTPETGAPAPSIVYPSDQTRFPRNLYRTLFQWYSEGFTEFRLIFEGPNSKVTVYNDGVHGLCGNANPAAGCWEVDESAWNWIAASNAGDTATWLVDALDTTGQTPVVRRSASITLGFSKQDVEGAIFYWSTTSAGIRRGKISQQDPEDYIVGKPQGTVYGSDEVGCVACHTVSRDGRYMVAPVKSDETGSLWVMEVTADAPPNPLVTDVANTGGHGFATISPNNEHVVVSFKEDYMWMVDRATGAKIVDLPTNTMEMDGGTHPDWSPDNTQLVFATGQGDGPNDASLAIVPWDGNAWGQPAILLAPPMGKTNVFPMFSHDGNYIAFAQGDGAGHGEESLQLWVVDKAGNTPVEMINANRITSNQTMDGQYQNSQPTWAPPGDFDWVAFNTKREYGVVLDEGTQQIWVSAVDVDKAANGQDPSYPAFRVPFQGLDENNHRAFWTLDIGEEGGGGGGAGGSGGGNNGCNDILTLGEICDPNNDCCETGSYCDTLDQGVTYVCVSVVPN